MSERQAQPASSLNDQLTTAQLKKLNLEIASIERQKRWLETFGQIAPAVTTVVAIAALVFSVSQAITAQRDERINKVQGQIRADKEQILDFLNSEKTSSVRVAFLIDDLNSLLGQLPAREPEAGMITEHLMRIAWELRFEQRRDFDYDAAALRRWPGYRKFWQDYPGPHQLFLAAKYYPSVAQLRAQNAACIERLDFETGTDLLTYKNADRPCPEPVINALIYGFKEHLATIRETNRPELLRKELD